MRWRSLGQQCRKKGIWKKRWRWQRRAIAIRPDHPEAHLNLAFVLLAQGRFAEGWREYEWRRRQVAGERTFSCPQWQSEELAGRRILIHAEQGLGDALQFVRYVPGVRERGGKVILECYEELERLFAQVPGMEELVKAGTPLPEFDLHCPMLSLPLAFGMTAESIPSETPYLTADPELSRQWATKLPATEKVKVGLAWGGGDRISTTGIDPFQARFSIGWRISRGRLISACRSWNQRQAFRARICR